MRINVIFSAAAVAKSLQLSSPYQSNQYSQQFEAFISTKSEAVAVATAFRVLN
jgi:hypothetical protein